MKLGRPRPSTLGAGALIVAGLATSQALNSVMPDLDVSAFGSGSSRPFVKSATIGVPVELRAGTLKVVSVETTKRVFQPAGSVIHSPATFLVMRLEWTSTGETSLVGGMRLTDRQGRTFTTSGLGKTREGVFCNAVPASLTGTCTAVLEVPDDAIEGATVQLAPASGSSYDEIAMIRLDSTPEPLAPATEESPVLPITYGMKGL